MRHLLAICLAATLSMSCAAGWVREDGTLYGVAFGSDSKLERCVVSGEAGIIRAAPETCSRIEGGNVASGILDLALSILTKIFSPFAALF